MCGVSSRAWAVAVAAMITVGAAPAGAYPLVINEIDYTDPSGGNSGDFVEIKNISDAPVLLNNGTPAVDSDDYELAVYSHNGFPYDVNVLLKQYPGATLQPGEYLVVCTDKDAVGVECDLELLPTGLSTGARAVAIKKCTGPTCLVAYDDATLVDVVSYEGNVTQTIVKTVQYYETAAAISDDGSAYGKSISRLPDGDDTDDNSADFERACSTPGLENSIKTEGCDPAGVLLRINEVDYDHPHVGSETQDTQEFVEILNADSNPLQLGSYQLRFLNSDGSPARTAIQLSNVTLEPGELFVVCGTSAVRNCDQVLGIKDLIQDDAAHAVAITFGSRVVDTVAFEDTVTAPYTETAFAAEDDGTLVRHSMGRNSAGDDNGNNDADFKVRCSSPGLDNRDAAVNCAAPYSGVLISEVDYVQPGGVDTAEFIEIYNSNFFDVDLEGYWLELIDGATQTAYATIPLDDTAGVIGFGGYFVVCTDPGNSALNCTFDGGGDDLLQNGTEAILLRTPHGMISDALTYGGFIGAPYTEGLGPGPTDPDGLGWEDVSVSRISASDLNYNRDDFAIRCISPGGPSSIYAGACLLDKGACGNGFVDRNQTSDERCDDGGLCDDDNTTPCTSDADCGTTCSPRGGDGCSAQCQPEAGWSCAGRLPTVCQADCGVVFEGEELGAWTFVTRRGASFEVGTSSFGPGVETARDANLPGSTDVYMQTAFMVPTSLQAASPTLRIEYALEGDASGNDCMSVLVSDGGGIPNGEIAATCTNTSGVTTLEVPIPDSMRGFAKYLVIWFDTDDADNDYRGLFVGSVSVTTDVDGDGLFEQSAMGACDPCVDVDEDGYGRSLGSANLASCSGGAEVDCDDDDPARSPGLAEVVGNGIDEDCSGSDDCYEDLDGDGFGSANLVAASADDCPGANESAEGGDCNDDVSTGAGINPSADELVADGVDSDCDGQEKCYEDLDEDGYGSTTVMMSSDADCGDAGEAVVDTDCDDDGTAAAQRYPDNTELIADNIDQDCDGLEQCYEDLDGDGIGSTTVIHDTDADCTNGLGTSVSNTDTDDDDASVCGDDDSDTCDDCSGGSYDPADDGTDTDTDGVCDAGDDDDDGDGVLDAADNCPLMANADQADEDGDDIGDACDPTDDGGGGGGGGGGDGGCGCRSSAGSSVPWTFGLVLALVHRRRRRGHRET